MQILNIFVHLIYFNNNGLSTQGLKTKPKSQQKIIKRQTGKLWSFCCYAKWASIEVC